MRIRRLDDLVISILAPVRRRRIHTGLPVCGLYISILAPVRRRHYAGGVARTDQKISILAPVRRRQQIRRSGGVRCPISILAPVRRRPYIPTMSTRGQHFNSRPREEASCGRGGKGYGGETISILAPVRRRPNTDHNGDEESR